MIKFSAFADEVTNDFHEQLKFLSSIAIDAIELRFLNGMNILNIPRQEWPHLKKMLNDYSIQVSAIASPIGKSSISNDFSTTFIEFKKAVELALFFEAPFIRVFSYYPIQSMSMQEYTDEVMRRFFMKVEFLKGTSVVMVHENEAGIYGHNAQNCLSLARGIDSSYLKLVYDPGNFVWSEGITDNMTTCFPLLKKYIAHIHIKDWKLGDETIGSLPGEGDGQIPLLINELSKLNYNGFLTLEPHLQIGDKFGGTTTAAQFAVSLRRTQTLCDDYNLKYKF